VRCEEFEARLNQIIDERGEPGADAALAAHASVCQACEQLKRDVESMLASMPVVATRVGPAPAGLPLRVVADWQASRRDDRTRRRSRVMLAMAASLLVALIPAAIWFALAPRAETARPELIADEMQRATTSASETAIASHDGVDAAASDIAPTDAQPALVDQARETYEPLLAATSEQWASVWGTAGDDKIPTEAAPAQRADDEADAGFELAGIRPVAESASRSVAALLRVLPGSARALGEQGIPQ
jgi:hypothetical protein